MAQNTPGPPAQDMGLFDSFNTHDVYINWRPDMESQFAGWEASFRVENVFDTRYRDFLSNDNGKGRTFKVSLAKQFGW